MAGCYAVSTQVYVDHYCLTSFAGNWLIVLERPRKPGVFLMLMLMVSCPVWCGVMWSGVLREVLPSQRHFPRHECCSWPFFLRFVILLDFPLFFFPSPSRNYKLVCFFCIFVIVKHLSGYFLSTVLLVVVVTVVVVCQGWWLWWCWWWWWWCQSGILGCTSPRGCQFTMPGIVPLPLHNARGSELY